LTTANLSRVHPVPHDPELTLHLPLDDEPAPGLSIVIPACNEERTIGLFTQWAMEGMKTAGIRGEIVIVSSSSDRTREIALANGARVLESPRRGLGRAYIDAIPFIRGSYVLMGDADCTYDFRELASFVQHFRQGYEFVMGSRFRGFIEPGSMPALHRYLGTPVTTWILNRLYGTRFTDIHCGMRGITREALIRMGLRSQSWEYASEMVLKSVRLRLRTAEVPVRFYKDRDGRLSHHRRAGWFSPWQAAWDNLRAMFVYGADYFAFRAGAILLAIGLLTTLPVTFGPVRIGPVTLSLYWMLLGTTFTVFGLQSLYVGCLARAVNDPSGAAARKYLRLLSYNRSMAASALLLVAGAGCVVPLAKEYVRLGLVLPLELAASNYCAVTGLLLLMCAFLNFVFTLVLHAIAATQQPAGHLPASYPGVDSGVLNLAASVTDGQRLEQASGRIPATSHDR